jgi:drug/metabolite transporter (DMT)-like permease
MNNPNKNLLSIHVAVFLFGFSSLFARLINQSAITITFGRVFFSSIFLFIFAKFYKLELKLSLFKLNSGKDYFLMIVSGIILAVHWFCFIRSIQLSTVAIGTITFSTFPLFTSFLEPVFFKEKIKLRSVVCSIIMLIGIFILAHNNGLRTEGSQEHIEKMNGIVIGLVSGLTYAILSLLNRSFSAKYDSKTIVFYEQLSATIMLLPFVFIIKPEVPVKDLLLLAVLGIGFTAVAHALFVKGLSHVKVSTAGIISGLEAVYAIVLASILLREIPMLNEIAGGFVVLVVAFYMTLE